MENYKITQTEISQNNVKSAADKIEGSPQENKHIFDKLPELIAGKLNSFIDAVTAEFAGYYTKEEVMQVVSDSLIEAGAGDMTKGVYDTNNSGVVDNAEKLGGELPGYYAVKAEVKMKLLASMTDLGLDSTATFADTVAAVPGYTTVFLQPNSLSNTSWKLPISQGYIQITRRYGTRQVSVVAFSSLGEVYIATVDTNGTPTGEWNKVVKQNAFDTAKATLMPKSGGTFTGEALAIGSNRSGFVLRNCGVVDKSSNLVSTNRLRFMRKV